MCGCGSCRSYKHREACRRYRAKNREKLRAADRAYYAANREDKTRVIKLWQRSNPERVLQIQRRWRKRNNSKILDKNRAQRARRRGAISERYSRDEIYARDGGRCRYCDISVPPADWHLAHLVALSRGGTDTRGNVAVSCVSCNLRDGHGRLAVQLHIAV